VGPAVACRRRARIACSAKAAGAGCGSEARDPARTFFAEL